MTKTRSKEDVLFGFTLILYAINIGLVLAFFGFWGALITLLAYPLASFVVGCLVAIRFYYNLEKATKKQFALLDESMREQIDPE